MEEDNGRSFNCAESVLIGVNRDAPLPNFDTSCMKIASVLGGGIAGFGEVCGAISGAVVSLGLLLGTSGDEDIPEFKAKRSEARRIVKEYLQEFTESWGTVQCRFLLEMDEGKRPPSGALRSNGSPAKLCNEYVDWSVKRISELRRLLE